MAGRTERQGKVWHVSGHEGNNSIVLDDLAPKQTVRAYDCARSILGVQGKVASVIVENVSDFKLVLESTMAAVRGSRVPFWPH